ncbi:pseudouridine synthase,putative [Plasmodium sp. DRC-Itaito]|nr:pseudouridine synthase,putative [Plasmodium sp. DRC-Itaito]
MICSKLSLLRYVHLVYYFLIISFCFYNNIYCFNVNLTKTNEEANIIRLNKLISMKRNISRRKSDEFIKDGKVKINNKIITNPGTHVHIGKDSLRICDKKIKLTNILNMIKQNSNKLHKWIVLHKPKGLLCTSNDEKNRKSIYTLLPEEMLQKYRLVTVGRLDRNTSGVLLLTNDYAWVNKLTHPKYQRIRTYRVHIEGPVKMNALKELARGIYLEDDEKEQPKKKYNNKESSEKSKIDDKQKKKQSKMKKTNPAFIEILREEKIKIKEDNKKITVLNISIKEGRNRQIRKMFQQINQPVIKIKRTSFENITLKNIYFPKQYRELNQKEVNDLKLRNF